MSYRGGASFAWQSDYAQVYLVDAGSASNFRAPEDITSEMMQRRWHGVPSGLVVCTNDTLQQVIEIRIFGAEPPVDASEWRSGRPWSQVELARAAFPSKQFALSSPSKAGTEGYGPAFRLDTADVSVRILWMEFGGNRYDTAPVQPDVIRIDLWPHDGS